MLQEIKRFIHDDSGPELIEWAVVTIILLLATIVILGAIRGALADIYRNILGYLESDTLTTEEPR
ncbi:MAG: Flp family type IVb pilin [Acidobacteriota bacterium]